MSKHRIKVTSAIALRRRCLPGLMPLRRFKKKSSFDAQDSSTSCGIDFLSCGLLRHRSWTSLSSLRTDDWKSLVKRYKKRRSARRRYTFGKLKNEDSSFTNIILGKALGSGANGTVYVADRNGQSVAVKIVSMSVTESRVIPETYISEISHHNIIQIMAVRQNIDTSNVSDREQSFLTLSWDSFSSGSFTELAKGLPSKEGGQPYPSQETWIMMEYCDLGSLSEGISAKRFHCGEDLARPNMERILSVAYQIADAMACLHSMGIVHGDLKTQNVLLKSDSKSSVGFVPKLGDFGSSRMLQKKQQLLRTNTWGTVDHMPPEVLRDGEVRTATDVFSFGMILLEFMTGKRPFHRRTSAAILMAIVQGVRPEIPYFVPGAYADLIQSCWHQDWKKRPQFKDILRRLNAMNAQLHLLQAHIEDKIKFGPSASNSSNT